MLLQGAVCLYVYFPARTDFEWSLARGSLCVKGNSIIGGRLLIRWLSTVCRGFAVPASRSKLTPQLGDGLCYPCGCSVPGFLLDLLPVLSPPHLLSLPGVDDWLSLSLSQTSHCRVLMGRGVIFSIEDMDV